MSAGPGGGLDGGHEVDRLLERSPGSAAPEGGPLATDAAAPRPPTAAEAGRATPAWVGSGRGAGSVPRKPRTLRVLLVGHEILTLLALERKLEKLYCSHIGAFPLALGRAVFGEVAFERIQSSLDLQAQRTEWFGTRAPHHPVPRQPARSPSLCYLTFGIVPA